MPPGYCSVGGSQVSASNPGSPVGWNFDRLAARPVDKKRVPTIRLHGVDGFWSSSTQNGNLRTSFQPKLSTTKACSSCQPWDEGTFHENDYECETLRSIQSLQATRKRGWNSVRLFVTTTAFTVCLRRRGRHFITTVNRRNVRKIRPDIRKQWIVLYIKRIFW